MIQESGHTAHIDCVYAIQNITGEQCPTNDCKPSIWKDCGKKQRKGACAKQTLEQNRFRNNCTTFNQSLLDEF